MIFHWVLNSLFVFLILAAICELSIYAFKINNHRLRYICPSLPLLKLPFDLFIFETYGDSLWVDFNPLSCELYFHSLLLNILPLHFQTELSRIEHFIVPLYFATFIPSLWLQAFILMVVVVTLGTACIKSIQFFHSLKELKRIVHSSKTCLRTISNLRLQKKLDKLRTVILTSEEISIPIPFAANRRTILLPEKLLKELSQEEYEAVIAHEAEHLRWKVLSLGSFS